MHQNEFCLRATHFSSWVSGWGGSIKGKKNSLHFWMNWSIWSTFNIFSKILTSLVERPPRPGKSSWQLWLNTKVKYRALFDCCGLTKYVWIEPDLLMSWFRSDGDDIFFSSQKSMLISTVSCSICQDPGGSRWGTPARWSLRPGWCRGGWRSSPPARPPALLPRPAQSSHSNQHTEQTKVE